MTYLGDGVVWTKVGVCGKRRREAPEPTEPHLLANVTGLGQRLAGVVVHNRLGDEGGYALPGWFLQLSLCNALADILWYRICYCGVAW